MRLAKFAIVSLLTIFTVLAAQGEAVADFIDLRVAWAYNGIDNPGSYAPNPVPADFNELKGVFTNQNQTAGDNAANLHNGIAPFGPTGVGVAWAGWRRFNSNSPAAFSADRDWVDRAGTASQLAGNDGGAATNSSVTFSGLAASTLYKVEVVMTGVGGVPWDVRINALNANHSFSNTAGQNAAVGAWNPQTNGSNQNDWLVWESALSDSSGLLTISFSNAGSGGLDGLHAIRISGESAAVPEPTSLVLTALGGGIMVWWRRRSGFASGKFKRAVPI